jgi:deazaflavin-dependent oxidoreductase (nitroreductase family)
MQARLMGVVNVPMRPLLSLPFATPLSRRLMLVNHTGRRTGKAYRQPVSYVQQDTILLTPGGGRWKLNLRPDVPVRIRLRGRDVSARAELISDVDEVERLIAVMAAANPRIYRFIGIPRGPDGRLDRRALEAAVRYGFRIVRWHLDEVGPQG